MFFKKKKLFECDPKELDLERLAIFQGALISKLIIVNAELEHRYSELVRLSVGLSDSEESRVVLSEGANQARLLNAVLRN